MNWRTFLFVAIQHAPQLRELELSYEKFLAAPLTATGKWQATKPIGDIIAPIVDDMIGAATMSFALDESQSLAIYKARGFTGERLKKLFEIIVTWGPVIWRIANPDRPFPIPTLSADVEDERLFALGKGMAVDARNFIPSEVVLPLAGMSVSVDGKIIEPVAEVSVDAPIATANDQDESGSGFAE